MVNSNKFLDFFTRQMVNSWVKKAKPRPIPWTPLVKPVSESTVALISSAGIALKTDLPFDQEGERQNPWWGDPSYRILPCDVSEQDVNICHLHIDTSFAGQDLNCLMPVRRLLELAERGIIGQSAAHHYSIMGYILDPRRLLGETTPRIIERLKDEKVDIVVLVPA
jgi:D-proline reductase (dithiol) PrdB